MPPADMTMLYWLKCTSVDSTQRLQEHAISLLALQHRKQWLSCVLVVSLPGHAVELTQSV